MNLEVLFLSIKLYQNKNYYFDPSMDYSEINLITVKI